MIVLCIILYIDLFLYFKHLIIFKKKPILLVIIWLYYDESQIGSNYSITKATYIYYFLFSLTSIPTQICIDIFFFNLIENFYDYDFASLLNESKVRFKSRKTLWKRDDDDVDMKLKSESRSKAQLFMSPQLFCMMTVHISGLTLLLVGYITTNANNYSVFGDFYSPFIILFWIALLRILESLCMFGGKKLKIWKVKKGFN